MKEDMKFPIKYAVLELVEDGGYLNNYEKVIKGYIATRCYVVEDVIKYKADGTNYELFRVFFPNKNLEAFEDHLKSGKEYEINHENIQFDLYGNMKNLDVVYALYDRYEDAKKMADYRNEKYMFETIYTNVILDENYEKNAEKIKKEMSYEFDICDQFEEKLNNKFNMENGIKLVR